MFQIDLKENIQKFTFSNTTKSIKHHHAKKGKADTTNVGCKELQPTIIPVS